MNRFDIGRCIACLRETLRKLEIFLKSLLITLMDGKTTSDSPLCSMY